MPSIRELLHLRAAERLGREIRDRRVVEAAASGSRSRIPVVVVAFDNGPHVASMVKQLRDRGVTPIVLDNRSTDPETRRTLGALADGGEALVVRSPRNLGHLVGFLEPVYGCWPETFAYTDPDLLLHPDLPPDFLEVLAAAAERFATYKAGLALGLGAGTLRGLTTTMAKRRPFHWRGTFSIAEWERPHWAQPLQHESLQVYAAPIDTTLAVYRKSLFRGDFLRAVRVAGPFEAIHVPWFEELDVMSAAERERYAASARHSSWLRPPVP